MLSINTNVSSLQAQESLQTSTNNANNTLEQLATGLRINSAADDPAGLYIANGLSTQVSGTAQAEQNVAEGTNALQIADGALGVIQNNLQQIVSLTVEAANDDNSTADRTAISDEITALANEINQISKSTTFNGASLLGSSVAAHYYIQLGANSTQSTNTLDIGAALGGGGTAKLGLGSINVTTNSLARAFLQRVDTAINNVSTQRATLGADQNRLTAALANLQSLNQNYTAARSTIQDTDIATATSALTQEQIIQQSAATVLAQANATPDIALKLIQGA